MINNNFNNQISAITEIQMYLRNISLYHPEIPRIIVNGNYDSETKAAVEAFQKITGLDVTGKVNYATWNALVKENSLHKVDKEMPYKIPYSGYDFEDLSIGYAGDRVYAIKMILNNFCRKFRNYKRLEVNDMYDHETEEAIKQFQKTSMLPITGVVDKKTWNTLVSIYDTCKFYK